MPLLACPFCADEAPLVAAIGEACVRYVVVVCGSCGAIGPRAMRADPPGHAERLWNSRAGDGHGTA
jgi:hypothetical protein